MSTALSNKIIFVFICLLLIYQINAVFNKVLKLNFFFCSIFILYFYNYDIYISVIFQVLDNLKLNINLLNGFFFIHPILVYSSVAGSVFITFYFFININFFFFYNKKKIIILKKNLYIILISGLGLLFGSIWAQQELNWGGWWNWDLVEIVLFFIFIYNILIIHLNSNSIQIYIIYLGCLGILFLLLILVRYNFFISVHSFALVKKFKTQNNNYLIFYLYLLCSFTFFLLKEKIISLFNTFTIFFLFFILIFLISYFCFFLISWNILLNLKILLYIFLFFIYIFYYFFFFKLNNYFMFGIFDFFFFNIIFNFFFFKKFKTVIYITHFIFFLYLYFFYIKYFQFSIYSTLLQTKINSIYLVTTNYIYSSLMSNLFFWKKFYISNIVGLLRSSNFFTEISTNFTDYYIYILIFKYSFFNFILNLKQLLITYELLFFIFSTYLLLFFIFSRIWSLKIFQKK